MRIRVFQRSAVAPEFAIIPPPTVFTAHADGNTVGIADSSADGRYLQVNMDENLRIGLHTADEYVPLEQVSRGTIEQAYFALRMAAMDVLCGEEELPVILDESFAFYDENRLKETLKWLAENRTQVLLFTCQKREEEALSEMGIPYRKIVL